MTKPFLSPATVARIRAMAEERTDSGKPRHTQARIAALLGLGETTVYRVIHRLGGYSRQLEAPGEFVAPDLEAEAAAALARFLEGK